MDFSIDNPPYEQAIANDETPTCSVWLPFGLCGTLLFRLSPETFVL
jgi:hypothetical protein